MPRWCDRSNIAELHEDDGRLEGVTLRAGRGLSLSLLFRFLLLFLGASPCASGEGATVVRFVHERISGVPA